MCIYIDANSYILRNTISLNCKADKFILFVKRDDHYPASRQDWKSQFLQKTPINLESKILHTVVTTNYFFYSSDNPGSYYQLCFLFMLGKGWFLQPLKPIVKLLI